ncbi:unnamed protein product [Phaedon cochleariae]|uniref:Uncharacterized protein n=1 Tax=Phaedon cochleariae TaxID=80249 RepID=A0A9N9SDD4_PHACE|nr:unnamed protein product [Phaedon cochleariae]
MASMGIRNLVEYYPPISELLIFNTRDLLDVADVLSKATETVSEEEITDKNPHLRSLYEGLIMTESQLKSVFKRHGLDPVDPINEKFAANFHEALFQMDAPNKDAGRDAGIVVVVVGQLQWGFQNN